MSERCPIPGLDLVIDGGLRTVKKLGDSRESTLVLVRGAAGTGKTIFGSQLALDAAAERDGDVVYCCLELLPSELRAQLTGIDFLGRRLEVLFPGELPTTNAPRVFASVVDGATATNTTDLGNGLVSSLRAAKALGLVPKVLVVDSLSDGYGLGSSVKREVADSFSKFAAEQGLIILLIEEVFEGRDSLWPFVVDVAFELSHRGEASTSAGEWRSLIVSKSRFGGSQVGPHGFLFLQSGVVITPRTTAYQTTWAEHCLPRHDFDKKTRFRIASASLPRASEVTLVVGRPPSLVENVVARMCDGLETLRIDLARFNRTAEVVSLGLDMGPEALLALARNMITAKLGKAQVLIVGDVDALVEHHDPRSMRRALASMISIAHGAGLAVLLYESSDDITAKSHHFADVVLSCVPGSDTLSMTSRHHRDKRAVTLPER